MVCEQNINKELGSVTPVTVSCPDDRSLSDVMPDKKKLLTDRDQAMSLDGEIKTKTESMHTQEPVEDLPHQALFAGKPPIKKRPVSTSRNQGHSGSNPHIEEKNVPRNISGKAISHRSRSSRRLHQALSHQSSSNKVIGHAWANQTTDNCARLKAIRNEYSNPLDNLASLNKSFVPQIARIPPPAKINTSLAELVETRHKSGKRRRGHKTVRVVKAPSHNYVNDPLMQSDELNKVRLVRHKSRKMTMLNRAMQTNHNLVL